MRVRAEHKGKWAMSKHEFYAAYHFALQYNGWKDRRESIIGLHSVAADGQPHGTKLGNPTESQGIKAAELSEKMDLIESLVKETAPDIYKWLLKAVTNEGITFAYLSGIMDIPCGKKYYYERRRKFYYLLAQKIKVG